MNSTAILTQYRQAPRKVRLIADLVKGRPVEDAILELHHRAKRAAPIFEKLVLSAVANAKAKGMDVKKLFVENITVDKGPVLKRSRPRAHGRAFPIHKHTSHIVVTLTDVPAPKHAKVLAKKAAKTERRTASAARGEKIVKTVTKKKTAKAA